MLRNSVLCFCAMVILAPAALGGDQIYRWVDESGGVHFGDEPPPSGAADVQAMELDISPAAAGAAEEYSINSQLERLYRTRPIPPERPAKPPPPTERPYPPQPSVIYQPFFGPYYGYPSQHRQVHRPPRPGWRPGPARPPEPAPHPLKGPTGRLWLPR